MCEILKQVQNDGEILDLNTSNIYKRVLKINQTTP